jgi:large subunit ribosomal protein L13
MKEKLIIDASEAPLGRLASFAAKQSLLGKEIVIVNCDKALITGRKRMVVEEYKEKRQKGGDSLNGPHFPKQPEKLVKRTIRGMLPYKQGRGLEALKRIICHDGVPGEYESAKKVKIAKETTTTSMKLQNLESEI